VCGQLAGACWGESGIPRDWLDGLARRGMIETALEGLVNGNTQVKVTKPSPHQLATPAITPPTVRSYWIVEGTFLTGAYPGSPDQTQHRQRIEELWNAGIRTFINLVEEKEKNISGQPFARYDDVLRELANQAGDQTAHLRFPVRDLSVPSIDGMRSILDAVDLSLAAGCPVYLHCFGGVGRTGTTVCCWLLRQGLVKPANVIQILYELRQADQQTKGRQAPETGEQIKFVESWLEA